MNHGLDFGINGILYLDTIQKVMQMSVYILHL